MDPTRRLPPGLVEHARAFASGAQQPVEPRHASTVVLLRDGDGSPGSLQVYLLRRHVDMAFAAGMCVFPGGGVDPRDFDEAVAWAGPSAEEWAELMDVPAELARALVCAAVRETFEESGVLLAGPSEHALVEDTTGEDWEKDRVGLESREIAFTEFLTRRGLVLRSDLLRPWSRWITPELERRRYDTRFFVAQMPAGQVTRDVSTESDRVAWLSLRRAVAGVEGGQMMMLPPTYCTCLELFDHPNAEDALAAAAGRPQDAIRPEAVLDEDGAYLSIPEELAALGRRISARIRA